MRKTLVVGSSVMLALSASWACGPSGVPVDGPYVFVLFDDRHGLEGGEPVRMHDFDIGRVEEVDLDSARVRVKVRLQANAFDQLTEKTTFSVEEGDGTYLEAHVLDAGAPKLQEGARLEGADSSVELALRRAVEGISASSWFKKAAETLRDMRRDFDDVEWGEQEQEIRRHWNETLRDMEELAEGTADDARKAAKDVEEKVKKLAGELEEIGKSEEARKLRERMKELLEDVRER